MAEWQLSNYQQDTPRLNKPNTSNSRDINLSCKKGSHVIGHTKRDPMSVLKARLHNGLGL